MEKLFILAMLVLMTGCTSGKMIINGHAYQTQWVKTIEEVEANTLREKKTSLTPPTPYNNGSGAITVAYKNAQYLQGVATFKDGSAGGKNVVARIMFNQKVEMVRKRQKVEEKAWFRDVLAPAINSSPLIFVTCKDFWSATHTISSQENSIVYSKDFMNVSMLTDFTMIGIDYKDKAKELPLDDVCSVKSAELYLVELAKEVVARTEEYIKK